ncbi:ATP-binding protein [Listeria grandensis]|uniref:AAA family ATPase n=1 Tax=Listeria grandensis TaxID=1494963 RepID=UPI00098D73E6
MYLSSLMLKNFRSFGSSYHEIKFNRGLTVLVGENDSGKSAIVRCYSYSSWHNRFSLV